MKKCWKQNGRLLAQLHGSLTPAHAYGCVAQCFEGVQRESIFNLSVRRGPQAAILALRSGVDRSLIEVMAHRPPGSAQNRMYPSALCCPRIWPGFLFQDSSGYVPAPQGKERERNLPRRKIKPALQGSLLQCRRSVWSQAEAAFLHRRTGIHYHIRL